MRRFFRQLISAALLPVCVCSLASGGDWPQFLGSNRNGVSAETGLAATLDADSIKTVWKTPLGVGMSGIAVSGSLACTLYQTETEQFAVALDAATGQPIWKTALAPAYENSMGNGPRATPTISGNRVIVYTGEGILAALDLKNGRQLWSVNVPSTLDGKPNEYGCSCSPLVVGKLVVVQSGAASAATAAWDLETGTLAWKSGSGNAGYSSPVAATLAGRQQILVFNAAGASGLDPATGEELWSYAFPTEYDCNTATPVILSDSQVLISAGENHGAVILEFSASGNSVTAKEVWKSLGRDSQLRAEWQTPVVHDGHLYALDNSGSAGPITNLVCIRLEDRKTVWMKPRFGKSNLILADGRLWLTNMDGELVLVAASPKAFEELGRMPVLQTTRQAAAIANGRLYVRDDEHVVCLDVRRGK